MVQNITGELYAAAISDLLELEAVEVVTEMDLLAGQDSDPYEPTPALLARIVKVTASEDYGAVVLGNNLGAGVEKAMAIDVRLRDRTFVAWNGPTMRERDTYERLGYAHFHTRSDLSTAIVTMLKQR